LPLISALINQLFPETFVSTLALIMSIRSIPVSLYGQVGK
jgi:hypothetical protein